MFYFNFTIVMMSDDGIVMVMVVLLTLCRAVFLQRRSRQLLDNDELQVCMLYAWCIYLILDAK